ncbi:paternally-expressed gene 3 protein-like [Penaeus japonicus]|uniref:paternally-expressed gene 3 protein-like n=1 Tax=Penaeus japonicus TaxID=27405 RepID=UPI001C70DAAD|nr:paternally-expressed gene 3 protein-like [Penaeus japonicus]
MNGLIVISVAALVASGSASLLAYNGVYGGQHGLLGAYPSARYSGLVPYAYTGALPAAAPLTLKTPVIKSVAPAPVSYKVAPAPVSYNVAPAPVSSNVGPASVSYKVAPAPVSYNVAPAPVSSNVGPAPVSYNVAPAPVSYNVAPAPVSSNVGPAPVSYNVAPAPVSYNVAPAPVSYNVGPAPVSYNVAPAPVSYNVASYTPTTPIQSQYHAQDEIGQYSFGYAGGPSSRAESRDAFGVVRGSYNYVDTEGKVQTQHYVADALGFRVSGTNLPVAPDASVAASLTLTGSLPQPVQDTPQVASAKFAHQ